MHAALSISMISLLAFGVGFATQRGSVCGLLAARQIVETGRATRLLAFVTASLWALVIVVPLSWVTRGSFVLSPSYDAAAVAVIGGALYGLGTSLNGACMFGTLSRITSGNLSFIAALPGIALGARVGTTIASPYLAFTLRSPLREPSLGGFALLLLAAGLVGLTAAGIIRTHRRAGLHVGQVLRAARWRTSVAMTIIGVLGGLLFATGAPWSYSTLLRLGEHQPASIFRVGGPTIDPSLLTPLFVMAAGFTLLFFLLHLIAMRAEILRRRVNALRQVHVERAASA